MRYTFFIWTDYNGKKRGVSVAMKRSAWKRTWLTP